MKKTSLLLATALSAFMNPLYSADWYLDIASSTGRMEDVDATNFFLSVPWSNPAAVSRTGRGGEQCTFNQIQFTAPSADMKREWMTLVLTAIAAGKRVDAFGACNSNTTLVVSRVIMSYD